MPFQQGNTYGKGRVTGSKNRASAAMRGLMDEHYPDWDPVLAMAEIAQDGEVDLPLRFQCMKELAGYLYPKQRAIAIEADAPGGPVKIVWGKAHPSTLEGEGAAS